jgi:CubicO group peptidase (beta-lactamase class C family)
VKRLLAILLLLLLTCAATFAADPKKEDFKPAQSLDELKQQLEKLLKDGKTPGVSFAIVKKDGPEFVGALGLADVATNRPATADTLFRIGSTSKAFASLSILKLANEGRVSLDTPVHQLVPDVWFENRWEATDPVRVVNLLEHTTGWDDMSFREYASNDPNIPLGQAFAYDGKGRHSRWRPGTRMAYCNTGPAVAAYIVEKITGQKFEDYVQQNFFTPIGMASATYYHPAPGADMTQLYHPDGKTPYRYWNVLYRPAGSINASAKDMAAYVAFYLGRGTVNGHEVMPAASVDRMESPTSTWAAQAGLKPGYGLGDYWIVRDGFAYHGHNGGVEGGLTNMSYLPEYGVGYFFSINSGNTDVFEKVDKAIRGYLTRNLQRQPVPAPGAMPANAGEYAGWYEPDSPRVELLHFLERLLVLGRLRVAGDKLTFKPMIGSAMVYVPVEGALFRTLPDPEKKEAPDPVATGVLLPPNAEGRFVQLGGTGGVVLKAIPDWEAWSEIVLVGFVCFMMLTALVYAPCWILGGLSKRRRRPAERGMRWFPLLAVVCFIMVVVTFALASDELIERLGVFSVWSATIWLFTVGFALCSLAAALAIWRAPRAEVRRGVLIYSKLVTAALLIASAYLLYWGIIGLRTWA